MRHLTVRNVPSELAEALDHERRLHGRSLNQTVIDLLGRALGLEAARRSNGLGRLAGAWSDADLQEFEDATSFTEQIDEELWR